MLIAGVFMLMGIRIRHYTFAIVAIDDTILFRCHFHLAKLICGVHLRCLGKWQVMLGLIWIHAD